MGRFKIDLSKLFKAASESPALRDIPKRLKLSGEIASAKRFDYENMLENTMNRLPEVVDPQTLRSGVRNVGFPTSEMPGAVDIPQAMQPRIKLTSNQWKGLFRRYLRNNTFSKSAGEIAPDLAENIMRFAPPEEETVTTLRRKVPIEGASGPVESLHPEMFRYKSEQMPYDEAFSQYIDNPRAFAKPTGSGYEPPVDILSGVGAGTTPEEMVQGLAYKRVHTKPFQLPSSLRSTAASMQGMEEAEAIQAGLSARGLREEDLAIPGKKYLAREVGQKPKRPEIEEVVESALMADTLWKAGKGGSGKTPFTYLWQVMYKHKKGVKRAYKSPKDYFIYCFRQFQKNPSKLKQTRPDEFDLIEKMYLRLDELIPE